MVFLSVYWFLSLSRKVWTSLSASDMDFLSVLAAIIWENSNKQLVLRIMKALPFIHQPDWVAPKASDMQLIGYINTHEKIQYFFHVCCYGFSQGRKTLSNTAVYVINILMQQSDWCKINTFMQHSDWCEIHTIKQQSD